MLFKKTRFPVPLETRPLLTPDRLFQILQDTCLTSLGMVFHQVTTEEARALGGYCFISQVGFCTNLARAILGDRPVFSPKFVAEAEVLETEQERAIAWRALEALFSDLAKKCAVSRLKEQATANRRALRLVKDIEAKMIADYEAAKELGPEEARKALDRGEAITDILAPAMDILSRQARTRHDRSTAKRRTIEEKLREAGLPVPPRKRKKRSTILDRMEVKRKLQAAFEAVTNRPRA